MTTRRGVALITVLGVGACLVVLIGALLSLTVTDYRWQGRRQQRLQAYWDARSGLEHERAGDAHQSLQVAPGNVCERQQQADGSVSLRGHSGTASWQLTVSAADPQSVEEAP